LSSQRLWVKIQLQNYGDRAHRWRMRFFFSPAGARSHALSALAEARKSPTHTDSINNYVVHGQKDAVNPEEKGTKAAATSFRGR
jgi:hypothetical protein